VNKSELFVDTTWRDHETLEVKARFLSPHGLFVCLDLRAGTFTFDHVSCHNHWPNNDMDPPKAGLG
jgi:hypothetical protein